MACGLCEVVKLFGVAKLFLGALFFILVPVSCGVLIPTYVSSLIYSRYRQVAPGYTSTSLSRIESGLLDKLLLWFSATKGSIDEAKQLVEALQGSYLQRRCHHLG